MSMKNRFQRRTFLKALGFGTAATTLPFLRAGRTRASDDFPLRCVFISTHNGFPINPADPAGGSAWGPPRTSETEFDLAASPILAPLAPFQDRVLLVENLSLNVARSSPGGNHQSGTGAMLTGEELLDGDFPGGNGDLRSGWAGGESVDQTIARRIGMDSPVMSLQLGVNVRENNANNRHRLSYRASDDPMEPENSPYRVYDRLFGELGLGEGELTQLRRQRGSVLDMVTGDLTRLQSQLGSHDRATLEAHAESIRELERQLGIGAGSCEAPEIGAPGNYLGVANFERVSTLQNDLIATAFACDLTRVVTLMYAGGTNNQIFPWLGVNTGHHNLSHKGDSDTIAQNQQIQINAWYAGEVASLMERLDAIPEGDGTALDHTLIFWGNPLSKGNAHDLSKLKYVLAGGGGYFRTGRYVQYSGGSPSHNNILVSCANAMGLNEVTSFGDPRFCDGDLPELL